MLSMRTMRETSMHARGFPWPLSTAQDVQARITIEEIFPIAGLVG